MNPKLTVFLAAAAAILLLVLGAFVLVFLPKLAPPAPVATTTPLSAAAIGPVHAVIGHSVQGRAIDAYTYGSGTTHLVFVGGIHGGYEWNSVVVAYDLMDYLKANPAVVPHNESVTIIPDANPDAVYKAIGKDGPFTLADVPKSDLSAERFNADNVDLNRNFDCKWQPKSTWQNKTVSAGSAPFSEPEAAALRDYFLSAKPTAAVFWHSAANGVYGSQCGSGLLPATLDVMDTYAAASGYPAIKEFTAYPTTGASEDWLAKEGIPAITVEFKSHADVEWDQNRNGILALLKHFEN